MVRKITGQNIVATFERRRDSGAGLTFGRLFFLIVVTPDVTPLDFALKTLLS